MKHIMVPTDFSDCAANALDFAIRTARSLHADITLLHAMEVKESLYTDYMGVNKEYNRYLFDELFEKLKAYKEQVEKKEGIKLDFKLVKGSLNAAIEEAGEIMPVDLVIMGTLGASGIKEKLWGTKTARVIQQCHLPVLAVPHDYKWKKPEIILIATNQFEKDKKLLDFVFTLAGLFNAHVEVAVFTNEHEDNPEVFLEYARRVTQYEKMLKEEYHEDTLTASQIYGFEFEESLKKYIDQNKVDMLVMVPHERKSLLDRIFNPSRTKKMSYHTRIPLLSIPLNPEE